MQPTNLVTDADYKPRLVGVQSAVYWGREMKHDPRWEQLCRAFAEALRALRMAELVREETNRCHHTAIRDDCDEIRGRASDAVRKARATYEAAVKEVIQACES